MQQDNNIRFNPSQPSWILDHGLKGGLAISNVQFVQDNSLPQSNIRAVISIFGEKELTIEPQIQHFRILVGDRPHQNIKCFFKSSYRFIDQNISKTNVLVHCQAGVSRSATIVIAYLMRKYDMSLLQALSRVRQKRPFVEPNKGFMKQLRTFQNELIEERKKTTCMCNII